MRIICICVWLASRYLLMLTHFYLDGFLIQARENKCLIILDCCSSETPQAFYLLSLRQILKNTSNDINRFLYKNKKVLNVRKRYAMQEWKEEKKRKRIKGKMYFQGGAKPRAHHHLCLSHVVTDLLQLSCFFDFHR